MMGIPWRRSVRLNHSAGPDASSADACSFMGSVDDSPNSLKIGVPTPLGNVVGMAHIVSKQGALPANITACCHDDLLRGFQKSGTIANSGPWGQNQNHGLRLRYLG